ncbi:MAG: exodeoxyribonuclease III [Candidatus Omnitrophica bacterium]|jgi:exodeoxyribonuclease-3|nr:exodeoxyribonuclease III [Candidatus Omnitrophota bacterium]
MKILSWNVNGIRAAYKKGFAQWLVSAGADIVCVQETKAQAEQFPEGLKNMPGYLLYTACAKKKGYSGTAVWSRPAAKIIDKDRGMKSLDNEGRLVCLRFQEFDLLNVYFPNGSASRQRLFYKLDFYKRFLEFAVKLKKKRHVIICGDVNTAHKEIDLARPEENEDTSGFLPVERKWIDDLLSSGFIDTFRMSNNQPGHYSWWDYKTAARQRDVGWRIDYFFVSSGLRDKIQDAFIQKHVLGSDHCPVGIDIGL